MAPCYARRRSGSRKFSFCQCSQDGDGAPGVPPATSSSGRKSVRRAWDAGRGSSSAAVSRPSLFPDRQRPRQPPGTANISPLPRPTARWYHPAMLGEPKNQFSLTHAALSVNATSQEADSRHLLNARVAIAAGTMATIISTMYSGRALLRLLSESRLPAGLRSWLLLRRDHRGRRRDDRTV